MNGTVYATDGFGFLCLPRNITQRLAEERYIFDEADAWLDLWCHMVSEEPGNAFSFMAIVLFRRVFFIGYVPNFSMEPTLKKDSLFLGIRIVGSVEAGNIIVFRHKERLFVKRVAAVGGNIIEEKGQTLTVHTDCFYVIGDNTEHSYDSRCWKKSFVGLKDIVVKVCTK